LHDFRRGPVNVAVIPLKHKMNTITFERDIRVLEQSTQTAEFWRVLIDGVQITTDAMPFDASTGQIVLSECAMCYSCGMPEIAVRRTSDDVIIWFVDVDDDQHSTLPRSSIYAFDAANYRAVLGGVTSELPQLTLHEFESILPNHDFPRWEDALYVLPDLPNDTLGKHTLRIFRSALADGRLEYRLANPAVSGCLTFGLDIDKIPECKILLGTDGDETLFQFSQLPYLPIWLAIRDENHPFARTLVGAEIAG